MDRLFNRRILYKEHHYYFMGWSYGYKTFAVIEPVFYSPYDWVKNDFTKKPTKMLVDPTNIRFIDNQFWRNEQINKILDEY